MAHRSFEELGIPPGYGFKQLLFSPPANALVVQTCPNGDTWRPDRLYFRPGGSAKYKPIGDPSYMVSQESPFLHPSTPLIAYSSIEHRFGLDTEGHETHSGSWHSLHVANLETGLVVRTTAQDTIRLPQGFARGWTCGVVAFGDSGLFVNAALSKDESLFEYFIAELDEGHVLRVVAELPAAFM
jgi:hypothetical protein